MPGIDLNKALDTAAAVVRDAGEKLKTAYGNIEHTHKSESPADVVTELDIETEKYVHSKLSSFDSQIGFRGEELGVVKKASTTWIIDPIDGTAHFIRGMPFCTTMLALIDNDRVLVSIIYDFVNDKLYSAIRGQGAYLNGKPIHVADRPLQKAYVSFETNQTKQQNLDKLAVLSGRTMIMRTINCGWEFSMVAQGRLDGRIAVDGFGNDWDYAPGSLLVEEAGGVVANIGKPTYDYRNHNFIAANPRVFKDLTEGEDSIFPLPQKEQ